MRRARCLCLLVAGTVFLACEGKKFEPPTDAERLAEAAQVYTPEMFDTISWPDTARMLIEGAATYAASCRDCHGTTGEGQTEYARSRSLVVPSLLRDPWPYVRFEDLRRTIFTGHPRGMPTHGIAGLTPREIDGVAHYVADQLRPEFASPP